MRSGDQVGRPGKLKEIIDNTKKSANAASDTNTNKALVPGTVPALGSVNKETHQMNTIEIEQHEYDELKKAAATAKRAEQIASLTDTQKTYFGKLSTDGQTAFLAKSAVERETELKAQVEYVSTVTGDVYFKFDDARLVKNARRADEMETKSKDSDLLAKRATFAKKAGEIMKGYPTDSVHAEIVGAIETFITDEATRKSAFEVIAAGSAALISKMSVRGHDGQVGSNAGGSPDAGDDLTKKRAELRTAVEDFAKRNSIADYETAFLQATGSDQKVRALYEEVADLA
jgi:hypothetical protein